MTKTTRQLLAVALAFTVLGESAVRAQPIKKPGDKPTSPVVIPPPPPPRGGLPAGEVGVTPPPVVAPGPAVPPLPGEKEAMQECKKFPPNKKFKWELRGEIDLMSMLNAMSPMLCRPFIVPGNIRQTKVTILAPDTMTAPEAYRMFLSSLEAMGLTIQPEGKVLKIIESNRARESAIPIVGADSASPGQDQFVTRMMRLEHADLNEVKQVLDRLRSKDGDITAYAPTNTLVITDLGSNIRKMEQVVQQLDIAMGGERIWTIKLHTVSATEMATMLQTVFGVGKSGPSAPGQPAAGGRSRISMSASAAAAGGDAVTPGKGPPGADTSISQIIPDDPRNLLIIVSTEKAFQRILALVKRLDQVTQLPGDSVTDRVHVVRLENADADAVAGTLGGLGAGVSRSGSTSSAAGARPGQPAPSASSTPGQQQHTGLFEGEVRIASDKPTNSLVVLASGRDYITVRDLIKKLDLPRRQVFVEATILEISVDKARKIGVAWHGGSTVGSGDSQSLLFGGSEPSSDVNSLLFSPAALSGLAAGLRGPAIPNASTILGLPPGTSIPSFGVFVQLLQNNGDVNVVSMPHLLTTDNEKATIQVGQNLPFPGSLGGFPGFGATPGATGATGTTGGFGFGTSVQRQDVALKLEITPHVNDSDFVRLEIDNELSDVSNPNFNGLGPATSKRTVKSVVTIRDQQSIVLGGLIKDSVSEQVDKVPLLGDIPILGYLFKRTNKTILKQNLLIILTPYIIKDPADLRRIFERKVRERREFMERYSAFRDDRDYDAEVDYRRKRGVLEEINIAAHEAEQEANDLRGAEAALRGRDIDGPVEVPYVPPPPPPSRFHPVPGQPLLPGQSTVPAPPLEPTSTPTPSHADTRDGD